MGRTFQKLAFWDDPVERDGPRQMACDETLMRSADVPVLRIFRWEGSWVSAGYFSGMQKAILAHPNLGFCRRWTGGGIVVHEADFTFGLIVPRGENLAAVRAGESYRRIHLALAEALRRHGIEADLSPEGTTMAAECFAGAVEHDLMRHGAKIAGGAQRRTRNGLLHQGSIQGLPGLERGFGETLAQILADSIGVWTPPPDFERGVEALAEGKYATPGFLRGPRAANDFTAEPAS